MVVSRVFWGSASRNGGLSFQRVAAWMASTIDLNPQLILLCEARSVRRTASHGSTLEPTCGKACL